MISKVFFDTNILVYSLDSKNKKKQSIARKILRGASETQNGVLSTQVIQEFYVTAVNKLNMDIVLAKTIIGTFHNYEIVLITPAIINEAIDNSLLNKISFWDSLIISAAKSANCEFLYTEDLNHGHIIQGVNINNPFKS